MSFDAMWAKLSDPDPIWVLVAVVILFGTLLLRALAYISGYLYMINDTMQSCLHELEELSRELASARSCSGSLTTWNRSRVISGRNEVDDSLAARF
jgi:hypothetical protein